MADLNVAVRIAAQDDASGPIRGIVGVIESLGSAATSPIHALGTLTSTLASVGLASVGIEALGRAAVGLGQSIGVGLNSEFENTAAAMQAFTKDSGVTADIMALVRKEADATPFSFRELSSAVGSLIPSAKQAREPLLDLTRTAEILAASHPEQGLSGAAFALREAVSGDFTSIVDRFDLPRQYINDLKQQGVPNLEIVRRAMQSMGYDIDLVGNLSQTLSGRWSTFQDSIDGIRRRLSEPLFDLAKSGLIAAQDFLEKNQARIGEWADAAGQAIAATASAFGTGIGNILQALEPLGQGLLHAFDALKQGDVAGALDAVWTGITTVFGHVVEAASGFAQSMFGAGFTMIQSLASGIYEGASRLITEAVTFVADIIASFLVGNSPPPKGPLSRIDEGGYNVMEAFAGGVLDGAAPVQRAVAEVATNFTDLADAGKQSIDAIQTAFAGAAGSLDAMKAIGGDVAGTIKDIEAQTRDLDFESSKLKFTVDAIKDAYDDMVAPLQRTLDQIKNFRDFSADAKSIEFQRKDLALRQAEIAARGNKDAEKAVKSQRDAFSVEKESWEIAQKQLELDRKMTALPLEQQIKNIRDEQKKTLDPMQDQLRIMDEQRKSLDFQKKEWGLVKSAIDEAVKAATPKAGGGGGGGAKGAAGAAAAAAKAGQTNIKDLLPKKEDIVKDAKAMFLDVGSQAGQSVAEGAQKWFGANSGKIFAGFAGGLIGGSVLGPIGLAGGAALGVSLLGGINKALAERGVDPAVVTQMFQRVAERIQTVFDSLRAGASLGQTVNAAFGDLIPAGLNPALDALNTAFVTVKNTIAGVLTSIRDGGLVTLWQEAGAAISQFAPTAANVSSALSDVGAAVSRLIPQPLKDFVTGLLDTANNATAGVGPLGLLAGAVNTISGALAAATKFVRDHVAAQTALVAVLTAAATAWGIATVVGAAASAMSTATAAVQLARGAWLALNVVIAANPIGLVIVGLAALAAALIYAYNNSETFRDAVDTAFAALKTAAQTVMAVVVPLVVGFANTVIDTAKKVGAFVADVITFFGNLKQNVIALTSAATAAVTSAWNALISAVSGAVSGIGTAISNGFEAARGFVVAKTNDAVKVIQDAWTDAIPQDIRDGLGEVATLLGQRFGEFVKMVTDEGRNILTAVSTTWTTVQTTTSRVLGLVAGVVKAGWDAILRLVSDATEPIRSAAEAVWTAVKTTTDDLLRAAGKIVTDAWNGFTTLIAGTTETIVAAATTLWTTVVTAIGTVLATVEKVIVDWGKQVVAWLSGLVEQTLQAAKGVGQSIIDGIRAAISAGAAGIGDLIADLARGAIEAAKKVLRPGSPSKAFRELGETIPAGLAQGIMQTASVAIKAVSDLAAQVIRAAELTWHDVGSGLLAKFVTGITDTTPAVINAIRGVRDQSERAIADLTNSIGDKTSGWIGKVIEHRTELLRIFNEPAFKRGEGVKVLAGLEDATHAYEENLRNAVAATEASLEKMATDYSAAIKDARSQAFDQSAQAVLDAQTKIAEITEQRSLERRIQAQKDAYAEMVRVQKAALDASLAQMNAALKQQESVAQINFQAQLKSQRVGVDAAPGVTAAQGVLDTQTEMLRIQYEETRDLGRAATEDAKAEITKRAEDARTALQDRLAEEKFLADATKELRLNLQREQIEAERVQALQALQDQQAQDLYVAAQTADLRAQILTRQSDFDQAMARQDAAFQEQLDADAFTRQVDQINRERDARVKAISDALAQREQALTDAYAKEQAAQIANLQKQLADYRTEYLDKITQAFKDAQVDLVDFADAINNDLANRTLVISNRILDMVNTLRGLHGALGDTPTIQPLPSGTPVPDTLNFNGAAQAARTPAAGTTVNVYPLTANLDSASLSREMWRQGMLAGG